MKFFFIRSLFVILFAFTIVSCFFDQSASKTVDSYLEAVMADKPTSSYKNTEFFKSLATGSDVNGYWNQIYEGARASFNKIEDYYLLDFEILREIEKESQTEVTTELTFRSVAGSSIYKNYKFILVDNKIVAIE